jgi:tetratricopeptide (TPR) repeat protein
MVVEERAPSGDEEADFAAMLTKFKQGVAEHVDAEDHDSHYDLGVAYREMGLVEEAIASFQRALRGTAHRARTYEALGQCFIDRGQHAVAASVLQRALQEVGLDDHQLVGVLYLLGRAAEAMNQRSDAVRYYERVLAVDITFADVADRIGAAEQVGT